jgi:hypothetical protein
VSASQVAQWNKTSPQGAFKAGETIVVMLAAPGRSRPAAKGLGKVAAPAAQKKTTRIAAKPASTTGRRIARPTVTARTRQAPN